MNNQEKMFCIDDLMSELHFYINQELQNSGKPHIEAETYPYAEGETYWIDADRERLQQVFVILLDNAVKYIERGFIVFGYFAGETNVIDFFVDDTRFTRMRKYDDEDLSIARGLLEQMGSQLIGQQHKYVGSSFSFAVEGATKFVEIASQ